MRHVLTTLLGLSIAGSVGCERSGPPPLVASPAAPSTGAPAAGAPATGAEALGELNRLDPRRPVPLLPKMAWHQKQNMQAHLAAIQRITAALAGEDWEEVRAAAATIGTSPQMQRMCEHMGAGAEGFTELALEFHRRADGIGEAAATKDVARVLRATSGTLQTCVGCHAAYRQEVVDAGTYGRLTGASPPSHALIR